MFPCNIHFITLVEVIKNEDKDGSCEAVLLSKLMIRPLSYGLAVISIYGL